MKFYFGFIVEVGTEVLMHFRVFFSFSRCWMRKSDLLQAKDEIRTTKNSKMNHKIFPKY